jgi:hypothetical protein
MIDSKISKLAETILHEMNDSDAFFGPGKNVFDFNIIITIQKSVFCKNVYENVYIDFIENPAKIIVHRQRSNKKYHFKCSEKANVEKIVARFNEMCNASASGA